MELEPGVEGLVHISRLADFRVAKPEDVIAGQEVDVKVLEINKQDQRISLSIKDAMKREGETQRGRTGSPGTIERQLPGMIRNCRRT